MPDLTNRRKTSMADIAKAAGGQRSNRRSRAQRPRRRLAPRRSGACSNGRASYKIDRALDAVSVRWLRIAILLQQPVAPYYVYLKQGFEIAQKAFEAQRVICAVTYFDNLEPARVVETISRATQKADALIIVAYEHPDITAALRQVSRAMPVRHACQRPAGNGTPGLRGY
jgi:LacI family transcriptional regulator